MSHLETLTFQDELTKLDGARTSLEEKKNTLCTFILSEEFLVEMNSFLNLLSVFSGSLITLVEDVQNPVVGIPTPKEEEAAHEETVETQTEFNRSKALAVAIVNIACALVVIYAQMPPYVFGVVASLSITLMFLPQISKILSQAFRKQKVESEKSESMRMEEWISQSIAQIRDKYTSAWWLIKIQNQTKESIPDYALLGTDEALYNRKKFFSETLPTEFLNRIDEIIVACDKNLWNRKSLLIHAITLARQATATMTK
jgi:hypothetical protein